jgi:hypothetical protein
MPNYFFSCFTQHFKATGFKITGNSRWRFIEGHSKAVGKKNIYNNFLEEVEMMNENSTQKNNS